MAMDLRELLRTQCTNVLARERDIAKINLQMVDEVTNPRLKSMFSDRTSPIDKEISNLETVVDQLGGETKPQNAGFLLKVEELFGVGINEAAELSVKTMMAAHRAFVDAKPPQYVIDAHDALEEERLVHLNIADYTGLIVLAKQLGENDIAALLQWNIDSESSLRTKLEMELPQVLADLSNQGKMAA